MTDAFCVFFSFVVRQLARVGMIECMRSAVCELNTLSFATWCATLIILSVSNTPHGPDPKKREGKCRERPHACSEANIQTDRGRRTEDSMLGCSDIHGQELTAVSSLCMLSIAQGVQEGPRVKRRRVEAQEGGVGRGLHTHARTRSHTHTHTHTHTMAASRRRTEEALSQKGGRQNMYYKKNGNERSEPRDNPEVAAQFTCFNGTQVQILTPEELQETLQAAVTRLDSVRGYQDEELIKVQTFVFVCCFFLPIRV